MSSDLRVLYSNLLPDGIISIWRLFGLLTGVGNTQRSARNWRMHEARFVRGLGHLWPFMTISCILHQRFDLDHDLNTQLVLHFLSWRGCRAAHPDCDVSKSLTLSYTCILEKTMAQIIGTSAVSSLAGVQRDPSLPLSEVIETSGSWKDFDNLLQLIAAVPFDPGGWLPFMAQHVFMHWFGSQIYKSL